MLEGVYSKRLLLYIWTLGSYCARASVDSLLAFDLYCYHHMRAATTTLVNARPRCQLCSPLEFKL